MDVKIIPENTKRGQITIFIIIAIMIVSVILVFFMVKGKNPLDRSIYNEMNPNSFMKACLDKSVNDRIDIILAQGGSVSNPLNRTFKFNSDLKKSDISYLCYTRNYYLPCINQKPMLIPQIKNEIKSYSEDEVKECFYDMTRNLEKQGYAVNAKYNSFNVEFMPEKTIFNINAEITLTKENKVQKIDEIKIFFMTKLYDLALVAQEIVSQEARFCNFNYLGYMLLYPQFNIDKFRTGESDIIYTIQDRQSKEKFRFVIRGCVIPPGI